MVVTTRVAPTVGDARRAADVLTAAGAGRVMLFGSVARGNATHHSDIDLIAIYDDIDYRSRGATADLLAVEAAAAAGYDVDVLITDYPEWHMRTTRVRTSLEARAALSGVVLADRRPGEVHWDKEMAMPTDDYQEGLYRLGHVVNALGRIDTNMKPSSLELLSAEQGHLEGVVVDNMGRMLALGGAAHSVAEHSVKALIHVTCNIAAERWGHRIEELCSELPDGTRSDVERLLDPLSPESITPWHRWERYHRRGKDPDPHAEVVVPLVRAACALATYTVGHFGVEASAVLVRASVGVIEEYLDTHDLDSGRRLPHPPPSTPGAGL